MLDCIYIDWRDLTGSIVAQRLWMLPDTSLADARMCAEALCEALQAVSGAAIIGYRVRYRVVSTFAAGRGDGIDGAGIIYFEEDAEAPSSMSELVLPGIGAGLLLPLADAIGITLDLADPDISALTTYYAGNCCNPFGVSCPTVTSSVVRQ